MGFGMTNKEIINYQLLIDCLYKFQKALYIEIQFYSKSLMIPKYLRTIRRVNQILVDLSSDENSWKAFMS